jgi:hypothetical protein
MSSADAATGHAPTAATLPTTAARDSNLDLIKTSPSSVVVLAGAPWVADVLAARCIAGTGARAAWSLS